MNEKIVCEVMLLAYKDLEAKGEEVETQALRFAIASMNKDTYESVDILLKANNKKIAYCNTKVIIDEALQGIGRHVELKAHYIDGEYFEDIIQREAICERTYFKRLKRQKEKLYQYILTKYKSEYLMAIINDSEWLRGKYRALLKEEQDKAMADRHQDGEIKP